MSISSTTTSSVMQQMMQMQPAKQPTSTELVSEIMEASDVDGSDSLSIEEIGLSSDEFSSYDSDQDGFLSADELEETLSSKLDSMKDETLTPETFASFLSEMGVEVPPAPQGQQGPSASQIASDVFSDGDTDADGLMTQDELGISDDLFASLDSDEDGSITQEELEEGLSSLFSSIDSGEITKEEAGSVLSALGVKPPEGSQSTGTGSTSSSSETIYDAADANEDGVVTAAEQADYDGTSTTTAQDYALNLVSKLFEALQSESTDDSETLDLSSFKSVMSMVNNETQTAKTAEQLNTYVSNLDLSLKTA